MNKLDFDIKKLLVDGIDLDYFDLENASTQHKIDLVKQDFLATQQWHIDRVGQTAAVMNWLQGLPSCISIPFTNYDIIQLAIKMGSLTENASEIQQNKILDNYWNLCANKLNQLFTGYQLRSFIEKY